MGFEVVVGWRHGLRGRCPFISSISNIGQGTTIRTDSGFFLGGGKTPVFWTEVVWGLRAKTRQSEAHSAE